jgi:hypothetical protein
MAGIRRRSNGVGEFRLPHFSSVAFLGADGLHKEDSAMRKDSNSITSSNSVHAARMKLTILYKRLAFVEVQFRSEEKSARG